MVTTYTISKPTYTRREKRLFLLIVIPFVLVISALVINRQAVWIIAGIIGVPCLVVAAQMPAVREEPYIYLDEKILFDSDQLKIGNKVFEIRQLENLIVRLREYDGLEFKSKGITQFRLNGTGNYISFQCRQVGYQYAFYIDSEKQFNNFKEVFEQWYINRFRFSEFNRANERTYLFETLDYLQKHHFNKKYGLD